MSYGLKFIILFDMILYCIIQFSLKSQVHLFSLDGKDFSKINFNKQKGNIRNADFRIMK